MTEHSDEAKVRAAWESVGVNPCINPNYERIEVGDREGKVIASFPNTVGTPDGWAKAIKFTVKRDRALRMNAQEIERLMVLGFGLSNNRADKRILARLQAARAELMRGWRGGK